jgi:hypothetical protein
LLLAAMLPLWGQREHMHHVSPAKLTVAVDQGMLVARLGPLELPAGTDHSMMPQPTAQTFTVPFDGWITAYHPQLEDEKGAKIPGRMLHHVAFWNTARSDFLCPNKEEHIFGAGGEMNDWPALPGFGYRVHKGDRIRVTTMLHNPTEISYSHASLVVRMEYQEAGAGAELKSVYPAWFDVQACGNSDFAVPAGGVKKSADLKLNYSGRLLGVGGHLHDYGRQLDLTDVTRQEPIASLKSELDERGHIRRMPIVVFLDRGGFPLTQNDVLHVSAQYGPPAEPGFQGMGIVVGDFLPHNEADMNKLARR